VKADSLRELIQTKGLGQRYRIQLARALGLMSDRAAVGPLIDCLRNAETIADSSSAAQALGLIGDRSTVAPLLAILNDPSTPGLTRGFTAAALGMIAEKTRLPWNAPFSVDSNDRAKFDVLAEILEVR
jgi:HEAT repeat protein